MANKIRVGDRVIVIAGSNKGQIGLVKEVNGGRAIVDSVNLLVKHEKGKGNQKGKLKYINGSIDLSNLSHVSDENKPIKVRFIYENEKKFLVDKKDHSRKIRQI